MKGLAHGLGPGLGLVHSCRGRVLACTFLDAGKILLYNLLGRYQCDAVSKQILRGQFPGGLGSGLRHQVGRFECKYRHGVFGHEIGRAHV